eukprot:90187-Prorocentrum_minimum.AAC.1
MTRLLAPPNTKKSPFRMTREGDPSGGGLQGARPRAGQLRGPASRGLDDYCLWVVLVFYVFSLAFALRTFAAATSRGGSWGGRRPIFARRREHSCGRGRHAASRIPPPTSQRRPAAAATTASMAIMGAGWSAYNVPSGTSRSSSALHVARWGSNYVTYLESHWTNQSVRTVVIS